VLPTLCRSPNYRWHAHDCNHTELHPNVLVPSIWREQTIRVTQILQLTHIIQLASRGFAVHAPNPSNIRAGLQMVGNGFNIPCRTPFLLMMDVSASQSHRRV